MVHSIQKNDQFLLLGALAPYTDPGPPPERVQRPVQGALSQRKPESDSRNASIVAFDGGPAGSNDSALAVSIFLRPLLEGCALVLAR
jgi:hypothetical protein